MAKSIRSIKNTLSSLSIVATAPDRRDLEARATQLAKEAPS